MKVPLISIIALIVVGLIWGMEIQSHIDEPIFKQWENQSTRAKRIINGYDSLHKIDRDRICHLLKFIENHDR